MELDDLTDTIVGISSICPQTNGTIKNATIKAEDYVNTEEVEKDLN